MCDVKSCDVMYFVVRKSAVISFVQIFVVFSRSTMSFFSIFLYVLFCLPCIYHFRSTRLEQQIQTPSQDTVYDPFQSPSRFITAGNE